MRGTLFKAKSKDGGEWVEGYYVKLRWPTEDFHGIIPENTEMYSGNIIDIIIEIDPDTICTIENDGWIPVGKGLPEENTAERYIITDTGGCIWSEMWYGYVEESDDAPCFYRWDDDMWQCLKIHAIAWRPLPEPYQPETVPQRPEWKDRMLHTFLGGHHD